LDYIVIKLFVKCNFNNKNKLGLYYCLDNPGALHDDFKEEFKELLKDNFEYNFNLLYSIYSLPNTMLPLIFGVLVTVYGARNIYIILNFFVILGQIIFSLGYQFKSIQIMLAGRLVFGFGGESLAIAQCTLLIRWFHGSELALPLGLATSACRMGSVMNDIISPIIASV